MKSDYYFTGRRPSSTVGCTGVFIPISYNILARGDLQSAENIGATESARIAKLPPELQKTEGMVTCVSY